MSWFLYHSISNKLLSNRFEWTDSIKCRHFQFIMFLKKNVFILDEMKCVFLFLLFTSFCTQSWKESFTCQIVSRKVIIGLTTSERLTINEDKSINLGTQTVLKKISTLKQAKIMVCLFTQELSKIFQRQFHFSFRILLYTWWCTRTTCWLHSAPSTRNSCGGSNTSRTSRWSSSYLSWFMHSNSWEKV